MIVTELLNNNTLIKHYSDAGMLILQEETGAKYGEAIDVYPCPFTYTETDEPAEPEEDPDMTEIEEKAAAYDIITGEYE